MSFLVVLVGVIGLLWLLAFALCLGAAAGDKRRGADMRRTASADRGEAAHPGHWLPPVTRRPEFQKAENNPNAIVCEGTPEEHKTRRGSSPQPR